jgi:hypothetical protein
MGGWLNGEQSSVVPLCDAGLLQKVGVEGQNEVRMEATPVASLQTLEKQFMAQLQHKSAETWNYPGDPPASPIPTPGRDLHAFMAHGSRPPTSCRSASFSASS